jgi:hypothetical protein
MCSLATQLGSLSASLQSLVSISAFSLQRLVAPYPALAGLSNPRRSRLLRVKEWGKLLTAVQILYQSFAIKSENSFSTEISQGLR